LVKNEVDSIRRRDGELPPTAYIVVELATRLKTLQPWEGYDKFKPLPWNLRGVVEEVVKGKPNAARPKKEDKDLEVLWISPDPYDRLEESMGDSHQIGRSVDKAPMLLKKEKLKKKLKKVS
jgi:hypothetical protein